MAIPMKKASYTFADYLSWNEDERYELIDGEAFMLAAPSSLHQEISFELGRELGNFLEGKQCKVYPAPFDVRLFERDGDAPEAVDTVVQPDLSVICDRSKIDTLGCKGAPDFVIEVLSPPTRRQNRLVKLNLYQKAGVREYWLVDPESQTVQVFLLQENGYFTSPGSYRRTDLATVHVLPGCVIDLTRVFPDI
jgi:Uma2 family endonuclease